METATAPYTIAEYCDHSILKVTCSEVRPDEHRGDQVFAPEGVAPFADLAESWEGDFDSPYGNISQETLRDRRHRLGRLLDLWLATTSISKETIDHRRLYFDEEDYEPFVYLQFAGSIRSALEGRIFEPLFRLAAVGVTSDTETGRAQIGELHTANTLDELGASMLVRGMAFHWSHWVPPTARFLVMNLDREEADPSLHVANVIGGMFFAQRCWPELDDVDLEQEEGFIGDE